jgi:hypothetical protein
VTDGVLGTLVSVSVMSLSSVSVSASKRSDVRVVTFDSLKQEKIIEKERKVA